MWLPIRGTLDMTEATLFSQCVHDQQRRLEAEDCDSIRCAQLISGGRRRLRSPCTVPRSRSPHNVLHSPSNNYATCTSARGYNYIYTYTGLSSCSPVWPCRAQWRREQHPAKRFGVISNNPQSHQHRNRNSCYSHFADCHHSIFANSGLRVRVYIPTVQS